MPDALVGRTRLSHRIGTFSYGALLLPMLRACSNSEWGYRGFPWTKGTPKYISRNKAALVNISREQGNKPNFGESECGNLENSSIRFYALAIRICYCPSAITVFWCFINVQKDANEQKLIQAGRTMQFMHRICRTFCVHRCQQFCTLMVNGNADNQNLLIAVTHWVERRFWSGRQFGPVQPKYAEKVWLALATPLWKQLPHFAETPRGPAWPPAAVSIACHNRIEFYLFESNFIRRFLPREHSGSTGPGETTVGY